MEWLWNLHCFVNQSPLESPLCTQCTNRIFFFLKRQWFFLSKCFYMNGCYCFDYLHPYPLPTLPVCPPPPRVGSYWLGRKDSWTQPMLYSCSCCWLWVLGERNRPVGTWAAWTIGHRTVIMYPLPIGEDAFSGSPRAFLPWCITILKNWVVRQDTC